MVGLNDPAAAIHLLGHLRQTTGDALTAFELMPRAGLESAIRHMPNCRDPLKDPHPWYALIELTAGNGNGLHDSLTAALSTFAGARDAVFAASAAQAAALWALREGLVAAQAYEGGSIKNDIAVPVSHIADFITEASAAVIKACPGCRPLPFGHVGDGNVHFNISQPVGTETTAFMAEWDRLTGIVNSIALDLSGSISAEHGIGRIKREALAVMKAPAEMQLMQRIKSALDPEGIMNPGVILPEQAIQN
jgi:FAD/FMN-containing dehydrogenase